MGLIFFKIHNFLKAREVFFITIFMKLGSKLSKSKSKLFVLKLALKDHVEVDWI